MPPIQVIQFVYSGRALDKMWGHGIIQKQTDSVLLGRSVIIRNRPHRAAPYVLIGRDEQGLCLTIPIVPTNDPLIWRVITAWFCKPCEVAKLRQLR
jgi:hypothetical protein